VHCVHLGHRLCVPCHIDDEAIVDVAGLRAQALLEGVQEPARRTNGRRGHRGGEVG